jgi:hypothetical protein
VRAWLRAWLLRRLNVEVGEYRWECPRCDGAYWVECNSLTTLDRAARQHEVEDHP